MINWLRKTKRAVTLTEILLAIVILAFSALPIVGLLSYANRGTREQSAEAEAGNLAKEEMNRLMYVAPYEELVKEGNTGDTNPHDVVFPDGNITVTKKGNEYKGVYYIYPHDNDKIIFKVPKMIFHQPQKTCSAGGESSGLKIVDDEPDTISVKKLFPNNKIPLLADIYLEIQWKYPSEKVYSEKNKLILYGRRYHSIE